MVRKKVVCEPCEAEYEVKHDLDEDHYHVQFCPFCGDEQEDEELYIDEEMFEQEDD